MPKLTALAVLTLCFSTSFTGAMAQVKVIDPTKLPDGSKIQRSPIKIQVVDDLPKVTSTPMPAEGQRLFVIDLAPHAVPAPQVIRMSVGGNGSALPPGVVDLNALPASRLGTNIPSSGPLSLRNKLPQGQSSNGLLHQASNLSGKMASPGRPLSSPAKVPATAPKVVSSRNSPGLLSYPQYTTGAASSGSTRTTSEVHGKLERNTLLKKTRNE